MHPKPFLLRSKDVEFTLVAPNDVVPKLFGLVEMHFGKFKLHFTIDDADEVFLFSHSAMSGVAHF
jgi:hypothetical protein